MNHLQKQVIEDAELVLNGTEHNYLGPELVLRNCRIVLRTSARSLTLSGVTFLDCHVEAKKKLVNFNMWCATDLQGCSFEGHFVGNDFGHWKEQYRNGNIADCDFSKAVLDGCRFLGCDINSIKLPTWPCFSVLHPRHNQVELASIDWPGRFNLWSEVLTESPEITSAVVGYTPELVKLLGGNADELRETLGQLSCVRM